MEQACPFGDEKAHRIQTYPVGHSCTAAAAQEVKASCRSYRRQLAKGYWAPSLEMISPKISNFSPLKRDSFTDWIG